MSPALHAVVEPLGFLHGADASDAVAAGFARRFMGGPAAFAMARLHGPRDAPRIVPANAIGGELDDALARVTSPPPDAGLPPGPLVMGILNATPDSFSDAGAALDPARGVSTGLGMIESGAAILDIGGESTRPGAVPPPVEEEIRRVLPLVVALRDRGAILSVDTRRAAVMRVALDNGAAMINDVSGLSFDPDAIPLLAERDCTVCIMHMRGTPETMASLATYDDVVLDTLGELARRVEDAVRGGVRRDRIIVDPGIGFSKTAEGSAALLRRLPLFADLGARILLGVSRKSFIRHFSGAGEARDRGPGTLAALSAVRAFPSPIHRVHDVGSTRQFLAVESAFSRPDAPGQLQAERDLASAAAARASTQS